MQDSNDIDLEHSEDETNNPLSFDDDLNRLSLQFGAEYYSIVDEELQQEIAKRNLEMRDKLKSFTKTNEIPKSTFQTSEFIKLNTTNSNTQNKVQPDYKSLKDVLSLGKAYNRLKIFKFPYIILLDIELAKLLEWLAPTIEERTAKQEVLMQLEIVVTALFPTAKVRPFGSYVTGLSLPGADIDVCIDVKAPELEVLNLILYALNRLNLVHSFECIYNTNVPIVKVVDKRTGVRLDISVSQRTAYKTTDFIKEQCQKYKYMQPLVILLKLFLQIRNLGDVYSGGVGSYLLYCMVLSLLQLHQSTCMKSGDTSNSLATLFIDFFYYWGFIRDYEQFGTCVRGYGHVFPRKLRNDNPSTFFVCESPLEPLNDIGKNSHNMHIVRSVLQRAFILLKNDESNFNTSAFRKGNAFKRRTTILELLYDFTHPVFQNRVKGHKFENSRKGYFYEAHATSSKSLNKICSELKKALDEASNEKFNAQRQIVHSLKSKCHESHDGDMPFYLIAEAIANQENHDSGKT